MVVGGLSEKISSQMLKLKHSRGNMGLSLTCSFQELATRSETSEQAGVFLVSVTKPRVGGWWWGGGFGGIQTHHFLTESFWWRPFPAISSCDSHVYVCL